MSFKPQNQKARKTVKPVKTQILELDSSSRMVADISVSE